MALALLMLGSGYAQTTRIELQPVVTGLGQPVFLTNAKDGTGRRFIIEQAGRIRVLTPGSTSPGVFLDIRARVLFNGEQGLLGLAFHPQFAFNRRFFVNYTRLPDGATVIAEYHASASNPNVADMTETILLTIPQPYENHNGGMIEFGADGYLYIAMGDGGSGNDPGNRAQNLNELLGKILRIDVDRPNVAPADNPFAGAIPGRDEIYAYGFRNPWRFSFDRLTNQLYVGDVGQSAREEVDIVVKGGNYGWRVWEGTLCTNLGPAACSTPGFIPPILDYQNTGGSGRCSIIGGYVYRGVQGSLPYGAYIYGDLCSGEIFMYLNGTQTVLLDTTLQITSFGEDEAGELYVMALNGSVARITNPDAITASQRSFSLADNGAFSATTAGSRTNVTVGYAKVQTDPGRLTPSGLAIFSLQQGGIHVSETSVPASEALTVGRIYAEVNGAVNTGIAFANPNNMAVTISFYFTNTAGTDFGQGTLALAAKQQVAAFLNEFPFNGGSNVLGTLTFSSTAPVAAIALRGLTNERSEFLLTTLPVVPLAAITLRAPIPHFADGGGWTTQVVLVNPTEAVLRGTLYFYDSGGAITSTSAYEVRAKSATRIGTSGSGASVRTGSVEVAPAAGSTVPSAAAIFSFHVNGVTVTEAGVPALLSGTAFRCYVEQNGNLGGGLAIANPADNPLTVNLEAFRLDGSSTGLSATVDLPPVGQRSFFLREIPAFAGLTNFQGIVRVSAASQLSVVSLRTRSNERGEFLVTTTTPVDESAPLPSADQVFPHFVDGGGYSTQFVLFGRSSAGTVSFFDQSGQPFSLLMR